MKKYPRVQLQPVDHHAHAEILFRWRESPEIKRFMYTREPLIWESHVHWLRSLPNQPSRSDFVICLDGSPVGTANLTEIDRVHRRCNFGMYVAEAHARVQGVGAAAEVLALEHALDDMQLHKVSCEVFDNNPAPVSMHKRMGFEIEGVLRDHVLDDGKWISVIRMSLLQPDWELKRIAMRKLLSRLVG